MQLIFGAVGVGKRVSQVEINGNYSGFKVWLCIAFDCSELLGISLQSSAAGIENGSGLQGKIWQLYQGGAEHGHRLWYFVGTDLAKFKVSTGQS